MRSIWLDSSFMDTEHLTSEFALQTSVTLKYIPTLLTNCILINANLIF